MGSVAPVVAAFWYGYHVLGFTYIAANVLYNVAPNLVIRDTRRRLLRISQRVTGASVPDARRSDVAPAREACADTLHTAPEIAEPSGAAATPVAGEMKP